MNVRRIRIIGRREFIYSAAKLLIGALSQGKRNNEIVNWLVGRLGLRRIYYYNSSFKKTL